MEYDIKIRLFWAGFFCRVFCRVFLSGFTQKKPGGSFLGTYPGVRTLNIGVMIVMGIHMQYHQYNEVENAFRFSVSCLVRVHTDSPHNGHNKIIFALSYL